MSTRVGAPHASGGRGFPPLGDLAWSEQVPCRGCSVAQSPLNYTAFSASSATGTLGGVNSVFRHHGLVLQLPRVAMSHRGLGAVTLPSALLGGDGFKHGPLVPTCSSLGEQVPPRASGAAGGFLSQEYRGSLHRCRAMEGFTGRARGTVGRRRHLGQVDGPWRTCACLVHAAHARSQGRA